MIVRAITKWRLVATLEGRLFFETSSRSSHLFAHDLFRKPGSAFRAHALAKGSRMVVVQEFRQLLPQAFVALAFVTENDGPFKEGFLERLGQMAPEVERGGAKNKEIAVIAGGRFRCCAHHRCSLNGRRVATAPAG